MIVCVKTVTLEKVTLSDCVENAQSDRVVVTRSGKPVALVLGVQGMDLEHLQLGSSNKFWRLIRERRRQKTISRAKLEQLVSKKRSTR